MVADRDNCANTNQRKILEIPVKVVRTVRKLPKLRVLFGDDMAKWSTCAANGRYAFHSAWMIMAEDVSISPIGRPCSCMLIDSGADAQQQLCRTLSTE